MSLQIAVLRAAYYLVVSLWCVPRRCGSQPFLIAAFDLPQKLIEMQPCRAPICACKLSFSAAARA